MPKPDRRTMITNREVARIFDDQAGGYYRALGRWRAYLRRRRRSHLRPWLSGRVLDAGCGSGEMGLAEKHSSPVGLDLSFRMLLYARALFPAARLVQADAQVLPFADECFDTVLCSQTIYYLMSGPTAFVREASRVLKPGGSIVIASNTRFFFAVSWMIAHLLRLAGAAHREAPTHIGSKRALREILRQAGLGQVRSARFMFLPIPGFAFLDRTPLGRLGYAFILTARKPLEPRSSNP